MVEERRANIRVIYQGMQRAVQCLGARFQERGDELVDGGAKQTGEDERRYQCNRDMEETGKLHLCPPVGCLTAHLPPELSPAHVRTLPDRKVDIGAGIPIFRSSATQQAGAQWMTV